MCKSAFTLRRLQKCSVAYPQTQKESKNLVCNGGHFTLNECQSGVAQCRSALANICICQLATDIYMVVPVWFMCDKLFFFIFTISLQLAVKKVVEVKENKGY